MCFLNRIALVDIAEKYSKHRSTFILTQSFTEKNYLDPPTLLFNLSSEVEEGDWVALVCNVDGKYYFSKRIDRLLETLSSI